MGNSRSLAFPLTLVSKCVISVLVLVLVTVPTWASPGRWQALGPDGGQATALLTVPDQPQLMFSGHSGGTVFSSTDGGDTWSLAAEGILASEVTVLAMTPAPHSTLYAGTDNGIYRLPPNATEWQASSGLSSGDWVGDIVFDPTDPGTLYATVAAGAISGSWTLFRSADGGATWTDYDDLLLFGRPLAMLATSPPTLIATNTSSGVFRSTDGGMTWQVTELGLPFAPIYYDLEVDPHTPTTLYTALRPLLEPATLPYKSNDGGISWTEIASGVSSMSINTRGGTLAIDPVQSETLYWGETRGVFRSTNGGTTWQPINDVPAHKPVLDLEVASDGTVLTSVGSAADGNEAGLIRSRDGGASWDHLGNGFTGLAVTSIVADPRVPGFALASTEREGLLATTNGGATWQPTGRGLEGLPDDLVRSLASPDILWASTATGLFQSTDNGSNWSVRGPTFENPIGAVAQDPDDSQALYLPSGGVVWASSNGGETWQPISERVCFDQLTLAPVTLDGALLAGCVEDSGLPVSPPVDASFLLRSEDGGQSWSQVLDGPLGGFFRGWALAADPGDPTHVLAGLGGFGGGGLYHSSDAGRTWRAVPELARQNLRSTLVDADGGELWAGTLGAGVFRSTDDGATWAPLNDGLSSAWIRDLELDPHPSRDLWAATEGGVYFFDRAVGTCVPARERLCLLDRFAVEVEWEDFEGNTGRGIASQLTDTTGTFWFFAEGNQELAVKVLDGRNFNGNFWVFYAGLSTVRYTLTFTDTLVGGQRIFENPSGRLASGADTDAFPESIGGVIQPQSTPSPPSAGVPEVAHEALQKAIQKADGSPLLFLNGRFRVDIDWQTPQGATGTAVGLPLSTESGVFWFFQSENLEVFVKVLDGRPVNGHFWLFFSALSNLAFELTLTDLETGESRTYSNPQGSFASQVDTEAF